jgi:isoamylase
VLRAHSTPEVEPDHSVAASLAALSQTTTSDTATLTSPVVPDRGAPAKIMKSKPKPKPKKSKS